MQHVGIPCTVFKMQCLPTHSITPAITAGKRQPKTMEAEIYHQTAMKQYEDGITLIDLLSPTKKSKVLDLGCGTGYLSKVLGERVGPGGEVVGVDPDKARIKVAKEKYASSNVVFSVGSTDGFPEAQYDFVFSNYVLHWVNDKESAFKKVYDNLKPGGRFGFLASLYFPPLLSHLCDLAGAENFNEEKFFFSTVEGYEELSLKCGFSIESKAESEIVYDFPNFDSLLDWWHGTTHGVFKPALIDSDTMQRFKMLYGDNPIKVPGCNAVFLVAKF